MTTRPFFVISAAWNDRPGGVVNRVVTVDVEQTSPRCEKLFQTNGHHPDAKVYPICPDGDRDPERAVLTALVDDLDDGFADLVRMYQDDVYTVALRISDQPDEAEDLAAECFLRAYQALRGYQRERIRVLRPRSWLVTILLNIWRNRRREASRRPNLISVPNPPDRPMIGPGAAELVEHEETSRDLGQLVAALPQNQRAAVVLRHVVGLSSAEVATTMGISEGTAKSHTSRGLRRLRELYARSPLASADEQAYRRRERR
jgi:RNA polymerase sigma-70 factor (ECF subfamily)